MISFLGSLVLDQLNLSFITLDFGLKISDLQVVLIFNCLDVGFKIFDLSSFQMTLPLPIFSLICFVLDTFESFYDELLFLILPIDEISDKISEPVVFIPQCGFGILLLIEDLPEFSVRQIKVVILLIALFKHQPQSLAGHSDNIILSVALFKH